MKRNKPPLKYAIALICFFMLACICLQKAYADSLKIVYPIQNSLFPEDFKPPLFKWEDNSSADQWRVTAAFTDHTPTIACFVTEKCWRPKPDEWKLMKQKSTDIDLIISVTAYSENKRLSGSTVSIRTSRDSVEAPIFYREVELPAIKAVKNLKSIQWRLGRVSEESMPPVVLNNMPICANCHSASADGRVIGMDADYRGDKGAYVISDIGKETLLTPEGVISWSNVAPEQGVRTFGLFARLSPDGRFVASTINDVSVYQMLSGINYSQLFFPVRGLIAVYNRSDRKFNPLNGADDPGYVQSNPVFSPDGRTVVFIRADRLDQKANVRDFIERKAFFTYDLYRLPFNNGKGGIPEPVKGASQNGMSNYFPTFTPDGRWIIFTQSKGFMIIQPDAQLYIVPAEGGKARRMNCNFEGKMCSWHSLSPNGKWMVFSAKADSPYTQLWLTHIDENGIDTPPVLLENFTSPDRAANIPEFLNINSDVLHRIINQL